MNLEVKLNSVRRESKLEGILEGKQITLAKDAKSIYEKTNMPFEEIKELLNISDEDFEQILPLLNK